MTERHETLNERQCGVEIMISKGVGYHYLDVYPSTYYCTNDRGHEGPHIIGLPTIEELLEEE